MVFHQEFKVEQQRANQTVRITRDDIRIYNRAVNP